MLGCTSIIRYSILIVLVLRLQQGSCISVDDLTSQHSEATIRQVKSAEIFKFMNLSADPCEDFYEYTCGNFAKYNPVDPEHADISVIETLSEKMGEKVKNELENEYPTDTDADKNVKTFYRSCLQVANSLEDGYTAKLKEVLNEFGTMPALVGFWWDESDFDWVETLANMIHRTGLDIIFSISVVPDFNDNSINRVTVGEPRLSQDTPNFYIDDSFADQRETIAENIAYYLKTYLKVKGELFAEEKALEILNFEIELARGMSDAKLGLTINEEYFLTDMEEVQRKYLPSFQRLIEGAVGTTVTEVNIQTAYVEHVMRLLQDTSPEVVANYIFYTYITNFFFEPQGTEKELKQYCQTATNKYFYKNVENKIYRKYFSHEVEEVLFSIWRELKITFRNTFYSPRMDWIRDDTKTQAIEKIKHMKLEILSYEQPEVAYEVAQLDLNEDFVHNIDQVLAASGQKARDKLNMPPKAPELGVEATTTPIYNPFINVVQVPLGFLQTYYTWSSSYPTTYNYAVLGFFLAHEMLHGFDDNGRNFDAKGNARSWWDANTDRVFRERTQCFVDQYKELIYEGHHLPEMKMQAENIADGGGIRLAYEAYMRFYQKATRNGNSMAGKSFPDLQYHTDEQVFFISYANIWCSNYDSSVIAGQLVDTHTPNPLRDIGPLVNFNEFSNAFNCPLGTAMNPVHKCIIY